MALNFISALVSKWFRIPKEQGHSESVIVTFKPYIGAAFISARKGDLLSTRYFKSLPFDPERIDDEDRVDITQLSEFIRQAEEIESRFGEGALLDLKSKDIARLISEGRISSTEICNARKFRESQEYIDPTVLLGDRITVSRNTKLDCLIA